MPTGIWRIPFHNIFGSFQSFQTVSTGAFAVAAIVIFVLEPFFYFN
jgi:hypothetical protein